MTNLEQSKRLKESGFPQGNTEYIHNECKHGVNYYKRNDPKEFGQNNCPTLIEHDAPSEKELMDWLAKNTESGIILCSEITEDDLPYWELTAYAKYEDIEVKHADLTEALVMAVEAVLKGAK